MTAKKLFAYSKTGDLNGVQELLSSGVDIDSVDGSGRTALHLASSSNNVEVVKLLLERGADVDVEDNNGDTAL
jgi:ankyrin repeat protein